MIPIITKRHPLKFYGALIFVFLFLCALGTLFFVFNVDDLKANGPSVQTLLIGLFSLAFYVLGFCLVYVYWKRSPIVTVNQQTIKIGEEIIQIEDVENVSLTGKINFPFIVNFPMDGIALLLRDGTERFLYDDLYSNSSELKLFLQKVVLEKQEYVPTEIAEISINDTRFQSKKTFKGNQFLSGRGIALWGMIGYAVYMLFIFGDPSLEVLLISVVFLSFFWAAFSWMMNYFGISDEYLIVRNHNFFWKETAYRLADIQEVVFETEGKRPNTLVLITNDFRKKSFLAATLRDKTWLEMKKELELKGITVRNECIAE